MTEDEKINKLLEVYCDNITIARGEAYAVAFGGLENLPNEEMKSKTNEQIILTNNMVYLKLITTNDRYDVYYQATPYGRGIQKNGGWINHLSLELKQYNADQTKKNLEYENLKLQNDSLKNELKNRRTKEEIDNLTIMNLKTQIKKNRIGFTVIGAVSYFLFDNWKEILIFFGLIKSH